MNLDTYLRIKQADDESISNRIKNRIAIGTALASGHNGVKNIVDPSSGEVTGTQKYLPTWKSRGRQAAAIGSIGLGTVGGTLGGYYLGRGASDALGLSNSDSALARALGYGLRGIGAVGGGAAGFAGGSALASYMNNSTPEARSKALKSISALRDAKTKEELDEANKQFKAAIPAQIESW